MKKSAIFVIVLTLSITLLIATPASAQRHSFWPGFAVGLGTAAILGPLFCPPSYYYPPPPVVYRGGYYYVGPRYGYYGGYYRPRNGYYGR
ncbi:MAG TPA: hypothetical protein VJ624_06095, partial [Thermodesulfobacteriota bacterium]|nr:hypothetical protein [Thermodesulfobacteriota bacterium]